MQPILRLTSATRIGSRTGVIVGGATVITIACMPSLELADIEADLKACVSKETPLQDRAQVCQRAIDSDALNQKQMVVALYTLGHTYLALGDADQAVAAFSRAIERAPNELSLIMSRSEAFIRLRRFDAAIGDLSRAIELKPDLAPLYSNRGNAFAGLGDHPHALQDFGEAIRLQPDLAQPYIGRGRSLMANSEFDKAIADFTKAIEIGHPQIAPVYNYRGMAYARLGRDIDALENFDEAIRQDSEPIEPYFNRGAVRARMNNLVAGREDLERVVAAVPKHIGAQYALAGIDQTEGRYEAAIQRYDRILELVPSSLSDLIRGKDFDSLGQVICRGRDCP